MTTRVTRYLAAVAVGFCVLWGSTGCSTKFADSAALSERGYRVVFRIADPVAWLNAINPSRFPPTAEVIVRVQDAQGQPVDGVVVTFTVESSWRPYATFTPAEGRTSRGEARARLQASTTGVIPVMARVDNLTLTGIITMASAPNFGDGGS